MSTSRADDLNGISINNTRNQSENMVGQTKITLQKCNLCVIVFRIRLPTKQIIHSVATVWSNVRTPSLRPLAA